jgi:SET family sugar efflux transporter-like MFS transporter
MFALAREHADRTGREAVMFSSILRAQVSLAWVIGPPLAYALAMGFGFTVMYLSAAVVCGVRRDGVVFLPSMRKEPRWLPARWKPRRNRRDALLLFIICTLMWGTNSLYIINMPLFIIDELHLPEKLAGIMMGTAGSGNPTMLIAGYYAKRFGKRFDAHSRSGRVAVLYWNADRSYASVAACFTAAERDLYRDPRRDWHALLSGSDAGSGGLSNNPLYQYHPRGLDYCRFNGRGRCRNLELSHGVLDCAGDVHADDWLPDAH